MILCGSKTAVRSITVVYLYWREWELTLQLRQGLGKTWDWFLIQGSRYMIMSLLKGCHYHFNFVWKLQPYLTAKAADSIA